MNLSFRKYKNVLFKIEIQEEINSSSRRQNFKKKSVCFYTIKSSIQKPKNFLSSAPKLREEM